MSGDWGSYGGPPGNQHPTYSHTPSYYNTQYPHAVPSHYGHGHPGQQISPVDHSHPHSHPYNSYPQQVSPAHSVSPFAYPSPSQPQQPQPPQQMPTRPSNHTVVQKYPQQDIYSPHHQEDIQSRSLRTRPQINYAQQQPLARPVAPGSNNGDAAHELRLRNRNTRPNYKEPDADEEFVPDEDGMAAYGIAASRPRRGVQSKSYVEPPYAEEEYKPEPEEVGVLQTQQQTTVRYEASNGVDPASITTTVQEEEKVEVITSSRGRVVRRKQVIESSDEESDAKAAGTRRISRRGGDDFIAPDNDDDEEIDIGDDDFGAERSGRLTRAKANQLSAKRGDKSGGSRRKDKKREKRKKARNDGSEDDYIDEDSDISDSELSDLQRTSDSLPPSEEDEPAPDANNANTPRGRKLRTRQGQPMNYNEIAAFEKMEASGIAKTKKSKPKKDKMNWTGQDYLNAWGPLPGDDSDSDRNMSPKKAGIAGIDGIVPLVGAGALGGGATDGVGNGILAGGAGQPMDIGGTPSNLGRIGEAGLADADPLGVNTNVSFEDVGGLDEHVSKLKEMTLLPLLYPDMFQAIGVTPPRGVLFHGPPGTGKTLVARALAASCRSEGRSVSFFMRKGADCLSKWVGEAERQLRLLFEEAKKLQPSIIFFDEIDGLAPVRSSKQDQIHASIVSTLLALMDGMDGRGQVIVIGATNRPDAIDPALRRPGRFDREFYFPLPNFDARVKILEIMTKHWENWQGVKGDESRRQLAKLTKGYGGADLRALCTEAALNAIKRQYPQIYESSERLKLDHSSIAVQARDFMISVKEVVPSSARSSASAAAPLPKQLVPLLKEPLEDVKAALDRILPKSKKRNALEEAQWEEDHPEGEAGAFEREMMLQALESQRINRPRLLLAGGAGMGQRAVGAAALHYLEGYSVQSFDLGTLTGDSARTPETAIVQLFVEAKRHAPSIIYIPSLNALCASLPETCRALVGDSLAALEPHEPILLLAILSGSFKSLPRDIRAWFGKNNGARIKFNAPNEAQRREFFRELLDYVNKPPSQFPDAVKRRRRILPKLEIAPPLPPRELTAAEVAAQNYADSITFSKLKKHLDSIFRQCKKTDPRFCERSISQTFGDVKTEDGIWWGRPQRRPPAEGGVPAPISAPAPAVTESTAPVEGVLPSEEATAEQPAAPTYGRHQLFDIDMPRIHDGIWEGRYLTSTEFLRAVELVRENAKMEKNEEDPESKELFRRAEKIFGVAQEEVSRTEPSFNLETERMAKRMRDKQRKAREAAAKAKADEEAAAKPPEMSKDGEINETSNGDATMQEPTPLGEGASEERLALKRTREDDAMDSDGSQPPSKRMRMSPFPEPEGTSEKVVRFADQSEISSLPAINVNGSALPDSEMTVDQPSPTPARGPISELQLNGENKPVEKELAPTGLTQHVLQPPSRTPSPGPSTLPEFVASPALLSTLEGSLATKTANLDVEQLEALRAQCLNLVWKHRSDWNRDKLMNEMTETIHNYLIEIGELSEDEE